MQGALVYKASSTSKGNNFGILATCIGTAPIGLINLSWIITIIPVDETIRINVLFGLICLLLSFIFYIKEKLIWNSF